MKMLVALTSMYKSIIFSEDKMMTWEDEPEVDQTWVHMISYFINLWERKQRYGSATTRRHGYAESAANMEESTNEPNQTTQLASNLKHVALTATIDKEHLQQMSNAADEILVIIKEQQQHIKEAQAQSKE